MSGARPATRARQATRPDAGLEGRISGNWTAKIEYLYIDFGSFNSTALSLLPTVPIGARIHSDVTDNIVRVGLNYKFGGPIVAKY